MNLKETLLHIRPAKPEDKEPVLAFTAKVWNGEDYIHEEWDDWLADPSGPLLVGELNGQPVAMMKITDLGSGEAWLHGLRVADEVRRRGIGRSLIEHALQLVQQAGDEVARFMTGDENEPVHRIAAELGFKHLTTGAWYKGRGISSERQLVPLDDLHLDWLIDQVLNSELLARTHGLYAFHWRYQPLNRDAFREHLLAGQVLTLPDSNAWAIVDFEDPWLGFAHGEREALVALFRGLRAHPALGQGQELYALVPPNCELANCLAEAGFRLESPGERCYEWRAPGR